MALLKLIVKLTVITSVAIGLLVWALGKWYGFTFDSEGEFEAFVYSTIGVVVITVGLVALQFYSHSSGHDDQVEK